MVLNLCVCNERTTLNFHGSFEFPEEINSDGAGAKLENGVLTIDLPKQEVESREAVKKIEIK